MTVRVLFFAAHRELLGASETIVDLPDGATVGELVQALRARGAPWDLIPDRPAVAVNRKYADGSHTLGNGDEVAVIPPVAGG
ncbi:MAG: molybdopterin converting factor subunit 1 [Gemmatimonadota bacterium]|nr:molybdopterin converting factor subunit 1 [Gemmatimonadota bacterium]